MNVQKRIFGVLGDGTEVGLYTVSNGEMSFSCTEYGCTITSIVLNQKNGTKTDVVLGFSTLEGYLNNSYSFGAVVGRFANRIGGAAFSLGGEIFSLDKNDGKNTLHGGFKGFDKIVWDGVKLIEEKDYAGVQFSRISEDGEQGFPGNVRISVTYLLDGHNNLSCIYTADSDKDTPINLTNHAYFNLSGNGSIYEHTVKMNSDYVLEVKQDLIPTGDFLEVKGTPFDFTAEKKIGKDINEIKPGYDHCYVTEAFCPESSDGAVPYASDELVSFAAVKDPVTKNEMDIYTNMEGCQFYTANFIDGVQGKNGRVYKKHEAYCFETQIFPDSPNKTDFPSCILKANKQMKSKTVYSFVIG